MQYPILRAIIEQDEQFAPVDREIVRKLITENCAPFLAQWNHKQFLYRGLNDAVAIGDIDTAGYVIKSVRADRRPLDSTPRVQSLFDQTAQHSGFAAVRANSLFATGDVTTAAVYDRHRRARVVFPIGAYDFTWSPIIHDFHTMVMRLTPEMRQSLEQCDPSIINELKYRQNDDINLAIQSGNEIMIKCERAIIINTSMAKHIFGTT